MVREAGESREEVGHRVHLGALALEAWSAGENTAASGALGHLLTAASPIPLQTRRPCRRSPWLGTLVTT